MGSPSQRDWAEAIQELRQEPDRNEYLRQSISRIYGTHKGRYGYRRVKAQLRSDAITINYKKVHKLLVEMRSGGKRMRVRYKSYKGEIGKIAPNIIDRDFVSTAPNHKWTTDVAEIKIKDKKIYISPI